MAISMARAKALCSASELAVVKASTRQEIGALSAIQLRKAVDRSRKLRDKWRDQATEQRRSKQSKAGTRDVNAAERSAEKSALFDEVLTRFTAQLAKAEAAGDSAGPRFGSTKTARSRTHRAGRADARGMLREAKRELAAPKKKKVAAAKPTKPVKKKAAPKVAAAAAAPAPSIAVDTPPAKAAKPRRAAKPIVGHASALEAGRVEQGLSVTKKKQLAAKTSAKQQRLQAAGLMRIQKNRSAANKRNQARRDSR